MRFLFCRNHRFLSRFLCWYFKEPCSHFAIEIEQTAYTGNPKREAISDFLTHNEVVHFINLKLTDTQKRELIQQLLTLPSLVDKWKILYSIIFKKEQNKCLYNSVFEKFPSWLIPEGPRQRSFGLITAYRLYNLMLEHIRKDTVKIENIK